MAKVAETNKQTNKQNISIYTSNRAKTKKKGRKNIYLFF